MDLGKRTKRPLSRRAVALGALLIVALLGSSSIAAGGGAGLRMDASARHAVIQQLSKELRDRYVFPDRATVAVQALHAAETAGAFNRIGDPEAFAKAVNTTLGATLHDKHFQLEYSAAVLPPQSSDAEPTPTPDQRANVSRFLASVNYGLAKVVRLPANVGYVDVLGFPRAESMAPTLAAAMTFVSHTDTLIVDIRENEGGRPEGVALLCSYFLGPNVHINDIYTRTPRTLHGTTTHLTTTAVQGPKYIGKKVFVLIGKRTFSGGEEFAYDMRTQKRATLVGEVTAGGANPGTVIRIRDHFSAFIPRGRAINPITHSNWEGVGVHPDIVTPGDSALATVYLSILKAKTAATKDPNQDWSDLIRKVTEHPESVLLQ